LYQDALWLSESELNLSWLMLVSAVESAANAWRSANDSPIDRLEVSHPEFVHYLESTGIPGLSERVAAQFSDSIGTTKKFVDFLTEYCPRPPDKRPAERRQVDWSRDKLRRMFSKIYGCRSQALHAGVPFPAPMCQYAPIKWDPAWEAVSETPFANVKSLSIQGGTWLAKDMPMALHIFEYVVRSALNAWWGSLALAPWQDCGEC
jgi:hypothetical protein